MERKKDPSQIKRFKAKLKGKYVYWHFNLFKEEINEINTLEDNQIPINTVSELMEKKIKKIN